MDGMRRNKLHAATECVAEAFFEADMPSEARMFQDALTEGDESQVYLLTARLMTKLLAAGKRQ